MEQRWTEDVGKREIPEKIRRPVASSGTIPTCENPDRPWWRLRNSPNANHHHTECAKYGALFLFWCNPLDLDRLDGAGDMSLTSLQISYARPQTKQAGCEAEVPTGEGKGVPNSASLQRPVVHALALRFQSHFRSGYLAVECPRGRNFTALAPISSCRSLPVFMARRKLGPPTLGNFTVACGYDCQHDAKVILFTLTIVTNFLLLLGSMVAERLTRSPPTKANRSQSRAGSPDFRKWESCQTMPLVGECSRGSPVSPTPSFRRCSLFTSPIGSQVLAVKSRPNLFTHSLLLLATGRDVRDPQGSVHTCGHRPRRRRSYVCTDTYKPSPRGTHLRHRRVSVGDGGQNCTLIVCAVPQRRRSYVCIETYKPSLRGTYLRRRSGNCPHVYTGPKDDTGTLIKCVIATKRKFLNWPAVSSSPLFYWWEVCRKNITLDARLTISWGNVYFEHSAAKFKHHQGLESRRGGSELSMEQRRNVRVGGTGDPRGNPPTSGIVRHDSHMRKPWSNPTWNLTSREACNLTTTPPQPLSRMVSFGLDSFDKKYPSTIPILNNIVAIDLAIEEARGENLLVLSLSQGNAYLSVWPKHSGSEKVHHHAGRSYNVLLLTEHSQVTASVLLAKIADTSHQSRVLENEVSYQLIVTRSRSKVEVTDIQHGGKDILRKTGMTELEQLLFTPPPRSWAKTKIIRLLMNNTAVDREHVTCHAQCRVVQATGRQFAYEPRLTAILTAFAILCQCAEKRTATHLVNFLVGTAVSRYSPPPSLPATHHTRPTHTAVDAILGTTPPPEIFLTPAAARGLQRRPPRR
ncbi:hypothetical protein PR048_005771 [Dryococelus australis]|uniref:Uncharacterized protein n=1 Tax=Dryococelus australis TaxID=614101 RepID=A0ABQ9I960_9NEOP|nr:hypothetical protein PR048_005771 [Dryococelus australis]